jgi:hypothetical protein
MVLRPRLLYELAVADQVRTGSSPRRCSAHPNVEAEVGEFSIERRTGRLSNREGFARGHQEGDPAGTESAKNRYCAFDDLLG